MKLFIQEAAERDIFHQVECYADKGLTDVARRSQAATLDAIDAIDALQAMPDAGPPKPTNNPRLAGLRSWPVKRFDAFWISYLTRPDLLTVVPVPHSKRDIGTILEVQVLEES